MDEIADLLKQAEALEQACAHWDLANRVLAIALAVIALASAVIARNIAKRKRNINWEGVNVLILYGAFLAALLVAVVAWGVSGSNSRLAAKQKDINAAKERLLREDLSAKDLRISEAQLKAQDAGKEAGLANQSAALANLRAEQLKTRNLETEAKLQDTKGKLNWEWSRRTELEIAALPRLLQESFHPNGVHEYDALIPYAKTSYLTEYVNDGETFRAAYSLNSFLKDAGWIKYQEPQVSKGEMTENVQLGCGAIENPTPEAQKISSDCRAAQEALTTLLLNQSPMDWQADPSPTPSYVPPGVLWIKVGLKPDRFPWREWDAEQRGVRP